MAEHVTFRSEGDVIDALLYVPDGPGPFPGIVMAGGWCYVKELVQPTYAEVFREAGFVSLIFDYRRLGASEGTPRQHLDPNDQIEDYRNAISFLEQLEEVDSERIGVWGISYSGGHVLIGGAIDPRVRCVASVVPVIDGLPTMQRAHGTMGFRRLSAAILEARRKLFQTGQYEYMKHSSEHPGEELCTWPFPESPPLFRWLKETQAPSYENRNTVASAELLMQYTVLPFVERLVDTPTLMVIAERDDFTMWDLEVHTFQRILTPKKRLTVVERTEHHEIYRDQEKLAVVAGECRDWFAQHLSGGRT